MGRSKHNLEKEVHGNTGLPKKDINISNNQPNPTLQKLRRNNNKHTPGPCRRKEIIKIRAELNDKRIKEQFKGSINLGVGSLKR